MAALPSGPGTTDVLHLRYAAHGTRRAAEVQAFLVRDRLAMLALGGRYCVTTGLPDDKALAETLGCRRLPGARCRNQGARVPDDSNELDLTGIGFEAWIARLMRTSAPAPEPGATAALASSS